MLLKMTMSDQLSHCGMNKTECCTPPNVYIPVQALFAMLFFYQKVPYDSAESYCRRRFLHLLSNNMVFNDVM